MMMLPQEPSTRLLSSLGRAIASLRDSSQAVTGLLSVAEPLASALEFVVADPAEAIKNAFLQHAERMRQLGRTVKTTEEHVTRLGVQGIAGVVHRLKSLLRDVTTRGSCISSASLEPLFVRLWPTLGRLLTLGKEQDKIVEAVCGFHTTALEQFRELYEDKIASLAADLSMRFEVSPKPALLFTASILVLQFGLRARTSDKAALMEMASSMAARSFHILATADSVKAFNANPELVDDLFSMLLRVNQNLPDGLLGWEHLDASIRCAFAGLFSARRIAQSAVACYLAAIVRLGFPAHTDMGLLRGNPSLMERFESSVRRRPLVIRAIGRYTSSIVERLVQGAAGAMDRSSIDNPDGSISTTLVAMRDLMGVEEFGRLFYDTLAKVVPDSVLHPDLKREITLSACFQSKGPDRGEEYRQMDRALFKVFDHCMAAFRAGRFDIPGAE
jgi:hypothetical protein